MRSIFLIFVMFVALFASGCAPVLIGALLYDNASDNTDRAEWNKTFNDNNTEREKAGLAPLDFCSEMYKAKKSWAESDSGCAEKVRRFEEGDKKALNF